MLAAVPIILRRLLSLFRGIFLIAILILFYYAVSEVQATYSAFSPYPDFSIPFTVTAIKYMFFIMILFVIYYLVNESNKSQEIIEEQYHRSEKLLLNILPAKVAEELKEKGSTIPILFNSVSVFFTDFVGFTQIAEKLQPEELIDELDKCFSYFDQVTEKYDLEKLKTIGDAFMAAGGIPVPNNTHPIDVCLAALEIQAFMNQMKEIKESQGYTYWELRLGINTGNLVAGVVGEKKFAYDVWGDTVNIASRMESSGVSGKINISKATYEHIKEFFDCEYRGKVQAKHKGQIDMYFLKGIKTGYSVRAGENVPNREFKKAYVKIRAGGISKS